MLIQPNCDVEHSKGICERMIKAFSEKVSGKFIEYGDSRNGYGGFSDIDEFINMADEKMCLAKLESTF